MKIDLVHNIILKEAMSENFVLAVENSLCPMLSSRYGEALVAIQMYEDYLKEDFLRDGFWFYPLTLIFSDRHETLWIKWDVSCEKDFLPGAPYSFVGDNIDFIPVDDVPGELNEVLRGRCVYFEDGYVKLNVTSPGVSVSLLSGRFSQTFVDEMTRQISNAISQSLGVGGLADSTIELDMVFSPESYMEHTSENVTYRRLLMSAKGCAPRDFWIKWKKRDGSGAYSCRDHVGRNDIEFSLGEDVPHKVREKEYRYLVRGNSNKYQAAMGKKNITEWRELIKRALKRDELIKTVPESEVERHSAEVSDRVSEILERLNMRPAPVAPAPSVPESDDIAERAREMLQKYSALSSEPSATPSGDSYSADAYEAQDSTVCDEEPEASLVIDKREEEASAFAPMLDSFDIPASYTAPSVAETPAVTFADAFNISENDTGRVNVELLEKRLADESAARAALEDRLSQLSLECDSLRRENAELKESTSETIRSLTALAEAREKEITALSAKLELEAKERNREKALYAESVRLAREEQDRINREREERELARIRENERLEAVRASEEEERLRLEAHRIELERIESELRRKEKEKRLAKQRMDEERREREEAALMRLRAMGIYSPAASAAESNPPHYASVCDEVDVPESALVTAEEVNEPITPDNHPYTSVKARLIFRHNVDHNIIKLKLEEIIKRGLSCFNKGHVYIKLKASVPESNMVLLDFEKFPEGESKLLNNIINLIGHSDIGVMKVIVE